MKRRLIGIIICLSVSSLLCFPGIITPVDCDQAVRINGNGTFHQESFDTRTDESAEKLEFIHPLIKDRLKVTYPNGGQTLIKGKRYTIMWDKGSTGGKYVAIYLEKDGRIHRLIANKAYNDESHRWRVPKNLETCSRYQIGVYYKWPYNGDRSDKFFAIKKKGEKPLVGTWILYYKWPYYKKYYSKTLYARCDKTIWYKIGFLPKWGTWKRTGSKVILRELACKNVYKGKMKSATFMRGTMRGKCGPGGTGKWHARRKSIFHIASEGGISKADPP